MRIGTAVLVGSAALLASFSPAWAQDAVAQFGISELRAGVMFHDVYGGFLPFDTSAYNFGNLEDVSFDVLFTSPDIDAFRWIGAPRPNLGATLNLAGKESLAHLGLTWQLPLFDTPLYLEGTLGAAIHNGALTGATPPMRNLGCRVNFYESVGVGANLGDNFTATLLYEHTSNADLCDANAGLSNFGLKVGYRF